MKKLSTKTSIFMIAAIFGLAIFASSCSKQEEMKPEAFSSDSETFKKGKGAPAPGDSTIAQLAVADGYTELVNALVYVDTALNAGLIDLLSGNDQYTVFAPNNTAFFDLYAAFPGVDAITDLPAPLVLNVLLYHVTEGRRAANSVVPKKGLRTIQTALGQSFTVDPQAMISTTGGNTAQIVAANRSASNGIIHEINAVLLPASE